MNMRKVKKENTNGKTLDFRRILLLIFKAGFLFIIIWTTLLTLWGMYLEQSSFEILVCSALLSIFIYTYSIVEFTETLELIVEQQEEHR